MYRNYRLFHSAPSSPIQHPHPQADRAAGLTDARIAAMRAGGMSTRAIRRALGLSEAAATASGFLEPGRLLAPPAPTPPPGGAATNARGTKARGRGGQDGRSDPGGLDLAEVVDAVARGTGIDRETLIAPGQRQPVVRARQLAMYLIRELCPRTSLQAIGFLFERDHTTVLYGCRRAAVLLGRDRAFRAAYLRARGALTITRGRSRG